MLCSTYDENVPDADCQRVDQVPGFEWSARRDAAAESRAKMAAPRCAHEAAQGARESERAERGFRRCLLPTPRDRKSAPLIRNAERQSSVENALAV